MRRAWLLILLLISPLLLNDIAVILLSKRLAVWAQWAVDLWVYTLPLLVLLMIYAGQGWINFKKYDLRGGNLLEDLIWAVWPAALLLLVCNFGIRGILCGNLLPETWSYGWTLPKDQPFRLLVVVYAAATAGFFEEIIFRGWVTGKLREFYSPRLGALLSALLFAAIHWCQGPSGQLTALVFALLIQAFYDIYGNMRSTILVHVLYDLWVFW
jgi:membrane protease YdiL (CAAX protease family)